MLFMCFILFTHYTDVLRGLSRIYEAAFRLNRASKLNASMLIVYYVYHVKHCDVHVLAC